MQSRYRKKQKQNNTARNFFLICISFSRLVLEDVFELTRRAHRERKGAHAIFRSLFDLKRCGQHLAASIPRLFNTRRLHTLWFATSSGVVYTHTSLLSTLFPVAKHSNSYTHVASQVDIPRFWNKTFFFVLFPLFQEKSSPPTHTETKKKILKFLTQLAVPSSIPAGFEGGLKRENK